MDFLMLGFYFWKIFYYFALNFKFQISYQTNHYELYR